MGTERAGPNVEGRPPNLGKPEWEWVEDISQNNVLYVLTTNGYSTVNE